MTLTRVTVLITQVPDWCRSYIRPADIKHVIKSKMDDEQVIRYLSSRAPRWAAPQPSKIQVDGFCAG